jgi:tRNA modification GTPase
VNDTISAVSTPRGEGGIGIVRLSGPSSLPIAEKIFRPYYRERLETSDLRHQTCEVSGLRSQVSSLKTHTLTYGHIIDPETGDRVDEALVSVMKAPRTYTREDVVEINCHGGSVPLSKVLELTLRMGARLAEPGEFTRRAFLNGRIDLAQAEAVADIIRAKTDLSLKVAVSQLEGRLSSEINRIRGDLIDLLASVEASIDFPDEDLDFLTSEEITERIGGALDRLESLLATADEGKIITEGLTGVIIGRPNVGKSSLFNALLKEKRAIVTSIPGTTRDTIEEFINLDGVPLKLTDTAGLHQANDVIEIESMERTRMRLDNADLLILVIDASEPLTDDDSELVSLVSDRRAVIALNKMDLPQCLNSKEIQSLATDTIPVIQISATEETGLHCLKSAIRDLAIHGAPVSAEAVFVTRVRHKAALRSTKESLQYAMKSTQGGMPPELIAVDLRGSLKSLGEIVGETASEEILDQIFSKFCVGK